MMLVTTACGSDEVTGVGPPFGSGLVVTGSWEGIAGNFLLTMSLFEDEGGAVTGSGTLSTEQSGVVFDVVGSHVFPDLSLQLTVKGDGTGLSLEAVAAFGVSARRITEIAELDGTLTGGGFDRFPVRLSRHDLSGGQGGV